MDDSPTKTRFRVNGMDCAGCAMKVETAARRLVGVADVSVSVTAGSMTVTHAGDADLEALARTIASLGYPTARIERRDAPTVTEGAVTDGGCCDHGPEHGAGHAHGHDHEHDHGHGRAGDGDPGPSEPSVSAVSGASAAQGGVIAPSRPRGPSVARERHGPLHAHAPLHAHGPDVGVGDRPWWSTGKARLTMSSGVAVALAYGLGHLLPAIGPGAFLAALLVGLVPIARRAFVAARLGSPFSIEMLMTIAAVGAVVIGAVEEAAAVVFLFLVGELLEGAAAARARASIRGLADLVPKTARLEREGRILEVPAASLTVGDVIAVRPGDRIPADGTILAGASAVDEAPVTGESLPKTKAPGEAVFAGTVNGEGLLSVRVTATAEDNTIARVVRLVEEAQEAKAPTERFIDRFSRFYTPGVIAVAALVAVLPPLFGAGSWNEWVYKSLAILLIGCPCALVISTPAAIAAGLSAGARRGLLMKGGAVLERVGGLTAIAMDKTGTLTEGKPEVTDVVAFPGVCDEREVLALAAALEAGSSHPLAAAILARAAAAGVDVVPATDVTAFPGQGLGGRAVGAAVFLGSVAATEARAGASAGEGDGNGDGDGDAEKAVIAGLAEAGKSVSVLLKDGRLAGVIALRDQPRADARRGIDALKAAGITPLMLTGDNRRTAEAVATALGIDHRADLLPEDKQRIVRDLQRAGHRVGKVGDGINDAPALAAADIGIAMGGGTDVALETADAAVLNGRVADVARMVRLSRATMANIRQNITIALGLKAVFLMTTVAGITGLWPAILADTGATVLVTANAMRLLAWTDRA